MVSLHQLRCFLATLEHGSFSAAAAALGYAQPSISEQVRLLEKHFDTALFRRAGRGLVPTEAARALRPHAAAAISSVDEADRAVAAVREMVTGTVRFGMFRLGTRYVGSDLVVDVLERHPGIRLELTGQNSAEIVEQVRRGRLEAALVAAPEPEPNLVVIPVLRDDLVYVSAHPHRRREPVTAVEIASAPLVLPDVSWRDDDSTRTALAARVEAAGRVLRPRVEVEYTETALDIAAGGQLDTISWRGVLHRLADRLPPGLGWAPLQPPMHDTVAVVHRPIAELSAATKVVVEFAATRMRQLDTALRREER